MGVPTRKMTGFKGTVAVIDDRTVGRLADSASSEIMVESMFLSCVTLGRAVWSIVSRNDMAPIYWDAVSIRFERAETRAPDLRGSTRLRFATSRGS